MDHQEVHLSGLVSMVSEGGRKTPIFSGYKAHCQIDASVMQYSYELRFVDKDKLRPGDSSDATITFVFGSIKSSRLNVKAGSELQLNEGGRRVGTFIVKEVHE